AKLDDILFALWNLGENVLLAWTRVGDDLQVLAMRHYEIAQAIERGPHRNAAANATDLVNGIMAGSKCLQPEQFDATCRALDRKPHITARAFGSSDGIEPELVSNLLRRYGVSLVTGRAVLLLDAVGFSLHPPLEQVAMLNSLAYSVNSAHQQLL